MSTINDPITTNGVCPIDNVIFEKVPANKVFCSMKCKIKGDTLKRTERRVALKILNDKKLRDSAARRAATHRYPKPIVQPEPPIDTKSVKRSAIIFVAFVVVVIIVLLIVLK